MTKDMNAQKIKIIAGPTASGKSAIALDVAQKTGGVIINADSQQVYRDLPILTARPTPQEELLAPHKLYGFVGPDENFSAGKWLRMVKMEIDWARSQGQLPIVVGGTGMYLGALINGMAIIPEIDAAVVAQAEADYAHMGKEAFSARLREVDPGFFERLKIYDRQRLVRAYSVWLGTGKSLSFWQQQGNQPSYAADNFDIEIVMPERGVLYERCNQRFVKMVEFGAVEEVASLFLPPLRGEVRACPALVAGRGGDRAPETSQSTPHPTLSLKGGGLMKIIGVREIVSYLQGETSLEAAIARAQQMTRNYAKRQMTWFRNQMS